MLRLVVVAAALVMAWQALAPNAAHAALESEPLHTSGDRQLWHRQENRIELFGHAIVSQPGETLTADYVSLDLKNRMLDAKGNCIYVSSGSVIYGDEMHFNLDTRTGSVINGRVSNDRFSLTGERINKLGDRHFQTHRGEYTTCRDCPGSWSLLADDVDMEIEGYAHMSNVTGKITDVPAFWLPYLIVPMKTRRQTGLLFPSFAFGTSNGFTFVLPFFWAINQSADMTFGAGYFTQRGPRLEWEGRYALTNRSGGAANINYIHDNSFVDSGGTKLNPNRWGLNVAQVQELPFGFEEKLKILDTSDNLYPIKVGDSNRNNDVTSAGELNLPSRASLSYASSEFSAYIAAQWYRTLIYTSPYPDKQATDFDPRTVQAVPTAALVTRDRQLFGLPTVFGLSFGFSNFTRSSGPFDYDYSVVPYGVDPAKVSGFNSNYDDKSNYGISPIRKATRFSLTPSLYFPFRPFDIFSLVPSIHYFAYLYTFPTSTSPSFSVANLSRSYALFQLDLSTQLERIYEDPDDKDHPRVKHLIRPMLTYSVIPHKLVHEDASHPFLQQIANAAKNNIPGYYFDDYDIVPINASPATTNYFVPLGNSLAAGITTQWIRRDGSLDSEDATYTKFIEATAGEAFNFSADNSQYLTRFFSTLDLNLGRFTYSQLYYYYPYIEGIHHQFWVTGAYSLENTLHQDLFTFNRSVGLTYSWDQHGLTDLTKGTSNLTATLNYSLSDYFLPSLNLSYFFLNHQFQNVGLNLQFQSPSRCWRFTLSFPYTIENGFQWNVDLALNLTGTGYGGVSEVAQQAGVNR